ncbi:MAG: hypothetical protein U1E65_21495 [Myxococcota bacterium]
MAPLPPVTVPSSPVVQGAPAPTAPPPAPPPAAPARSAADDFIDRVDQRLRSGWSSEWAAPAIRTMADLDPAVLDAARAAMKELGSKSPGFRGIAQLVADEGVSGQDRPTALAFVAAAKQLATDPDALVELRHFSHSRSLNALDPSVRPAVVAGFGDPLVSSADRQAFLKFMDRKDVRALDPSVRDALALAYAKNLGDPAPIQALLDRAKNPGPISADVMSSYIRAVGSERGTIETGVMEEARGRTKALFESPEFQGLDQKSQLRWLSGLGSPDDKLRAQSQERLATVRESDVYGAENEANRAVMLRRTGGALLEPEVVETPRDPLPGASTKPPKVTFDPKTKTSSALLDGKEHPIERYTVEVGGRKIEVLIPTDVPASEGQIPSIKDIAPALAGLPPELLKHIDQVIVSPVRMDRDPIAIAGYNPVTKKNGIVMPPQPTGVQGRVDLTGTMSHEAGHLVATDAWLKDRSKAEAWKKAIESDDKWPSFYAANNIREDVAESIAKYYQVKGTPAEADMKRDYPARYQLLQDLLR